MVLEVVLPFFGATVTVTLHDPTFKPFSITPDTLQYFAELDATFNDTLELESTLSFAYRAIDLDVTAFVFEILGAIPVGVVAVVNIGAIVEVVIGEAADGSSDMDVLEVKRTFISGFE